jgi:5-formyltetrahydrofolate cyclo-ligase
MADAPDHVKRALRAEVRRRRRALPSSQREDAARGLAERLAALVSAHGARSVACYLSTPAEPGTRAFLETALARGIRVLLPVSRADGLLDWTEAASGAEERTGAHGVPEATGVLLGSDAASDVDLLIVPAAAVDGEGVRLGWGKGFYDRTLAGLTHRPPVYAVIYDSEVVDLVPREAHDQPVDGVVTPTRTVVFGGGPAA